MPSVTWPTLLFGAALLLAAATVAALYRLRPPPRNLEVASLLLWRAALARVQQRRRWRRLISLLLSVLFAWIVLAALAGLELGARGPLAVLVVATPCPLILAAPAAIIAGVSRAAKHGIIVKGGGPLETLARARVLLLDKTGTVTSARPQVVAVETFGSRSSDDVVRYAASVEQVSVHPFAPAILAEARSRQTFDERIEDRLRRFPSVGMGRVLLSDGQHRFDTANDCRQLLGRQV